MMARILKEHNDKCLIYIDDVVVWGNSPEECLKNVTDIVQTLKRAGITCNGEKCCFLSTQIELLGHIVEQGQLKP